MIKLTTRQQQVLDIIRQYSAEAGAPPTRANIAEALGFKSHNAAEEHLRALEKKGVIELIPGTSRGIRLIEEKGLPVVGRVAAGAPILAVENVEQHCDIPSAFFKPHADYLLLVCGDSMVNAGILDGDLLAVHKTPHANNGQIVVARLEDEVTVKRIEFVSKQHIQLHAENPAYAPIEVDLATQSFALEGISVGVIRRQ
jgi:repressor LexA